MGFLDPAKFFKKSLSRSAFLVYHFEKYGFGGSRPREAASF
jgi:hypothetical protein